MRPSDGVKMTVAENELVSRNASLETLLVMLSWPAIGSAERKMSAAVAHSEAVAAGYT